MGADSVAVSQFEYILLEFTTYLPSPISTKTTQTQG